MTNESRRSALRDLNIQPSTHIGLWLDRYLEKQVNVPNASEDENKQAKKARTDLIKQTSNRIKVAKGYKSAFERRMLSLTHGSPENHTRSAVFASVGRVIVGMGDSGVLENGLTVERTWGVPVLPGSALKGLAAAAAHKIIEDEGWRKETESTELGASAAYLFGTQEQAGRVTFHDAWWVPDQEEASLPVHSDIITAHNTPYYQEQGKRATKAPDGRQDPVPVSFLSTSGSYLVFVSSAPEDVEWAKAAMELLKIGLLHLGIGAKTNAGYGRLKFDAKATESLKEAAKRRVEQELMARLSPAERIPFLVAKFGEKDALDFVLEHRDKTELDEETMLYKEAFADRFAASWARGETATDLGMNPDTLRKNYVSWLRPELLEVEDDNDAVEPHPLLDALADEHSDTYKQAIEEAIAGYEAANLSDEQLSYLYVKLDDFWKTRGRKLKRRDPLRNNLEEVREELKIYKP